MNVDSEGVGWRGRLRPHTRAVSIVSAVLGITVIAAPLIALVVGLPQMFGVAERSDANSDLMNIALVYSTAALIVTTVLASAAVVGGGLGRELGIVVLSVAAVVIAMLGLFVAYGIASGYAHSYR